MTGKFSQQRTLVIIPTAGTVPAELVPFTQSRHSAMIRLRRKPVIYWTMDYLLRLGMRHFSFAVDRVGNLVQQFVEQMAGWRSTLHFAQPESGRGLSHSIQCAFDRALLDGDSFDRVLVVLGDTYFQFPRKPDEEDRSFILTGAFEPGVEDSRDWCLVRADNTDARALAYLNKLPGITESTLSIVAGVYYFNRPDVLKVALTEMNAEGGSGEFHHVLERYQRDEPLYCTPCTDWFDCGHLPNLLKSEEKMVQARSFNDITLDSLRGIITKRSSHGKLLEEITYYQNLPESLQCLFPRLLHVDRQVPAMSMEFYGYPSLSDFFVFDSLHPSLWEQIFLKLHSLVSLFRRERGGGDGTCLAQVEACCRSVYLDKTRQRTHLLQEQSLVWERLLQHDLVCNGVHLKSLESLWPSIEAFSRSLARSQDYSFIHGDLCFSNILYDIPTGTCRLIDPRGSFGEAGVYGDIKYDVAKLCHSVSGLYDFIINDFFHIAFDLDADPIQIDYRVYNHSGELKDIFEKVFYAQHAFSRHEIEGIEGLLFISMLPLHTESFERQLAMFVTGLGRLNALAQGVSLPPMVVPA